MSMRTPLVAFAVAFVAAVLATPLVRALARRIGAVDRPDDFRKIHQRDVPLLGGVAIFVALLAPLLGLILVYRNDFSDLLAESRGAMLFLVGGAAVALATGIVDDLRGLPAGWKLLLQTLAASAAFSGGFAISAISNPFGQPLVLGLLSFPVTLFWFLGCMNAVNLLDGLDGLAAGVSLFVAITLFLVSLFFGNALASLLLACLCGATLGFLLFNFHPASIFLGDSGSMLLGFMLGALSLVGAARKAEAAVALLIPLIALGLPIFDTVLAILRRYTHNLPISGADHQHVHHSLLARGLSHKHAVLVLYLVCGFCAAGALLLAAGRDEITVMVLGSVAIIAFVCVRLLGQLRVNEVVGRLSGDIDRSRRCASARMAVEKAVHHIRSSDSPAGIWHAVASVAPALELDYAAVFLDGTGGEPYRNVWSSAPGGDGQAQPHDGWSARFTLRCKGRGVGELQLARWSDVGELLHVAPELVERLRDEIAGRMEKLCEEMEAA